MRADKLWVTDPNGIPWELYAGKGSIEVFGDDARPAASDACCAGERRGSPHLARFEAKLSSRGGATAPTGRSRSLRARGRRTRRA